ncbi:DNA translocase FtsK [Virgibacillus alimentarius]|uniref:S-DNA-T family DNA segregation ATPase FtsK/SpoIIIE n=1 Tax=Virgibacillus alimentarius TaxID=698769 RepID=A0ABS4SC71_9BACI|nr:DNA translocase FtsK [Virgibacillus alimentarius]MBP2259094.1 S-DNA-T family DNA segregation ATPase FtsK/SpoIIIE [Virgibacillus alimentarius]
MWEQWKEKIKNLFLTEVEEEGKVVEEIEGNKKSQSYNKRNEHTIHPHIQPKVMYQYPNKKPFRFPVIPDDSEKEMEKPAYKRRESKSTEQNYKVNRLSNKQTYQQQKPRQKKVEKENKTPFTPSQVPSPIYGYQKRDSKDVNTTPPFIRNKNENADHFKSQPTYQQTDRIRNNPRSKPDEGHETQHFEPEHTHAEPIEKSTDEKKYVNERINQEPEREQDTPIRYNKKEKPVESKHPYPSFKNKKEREKKESNQIPFNVIMTPLDKKKLMDKNRQTQSVKKKENVISKKKNNPFPNHLLNDPEQKSNSDRAWVSHQQELLEETLKHFNVRAKVVNATQGPSVTRFEVQPELGVKVSKVKNLSDDLKLNMAAKDIRIEAPIPGKNTIGIEIPNPKPQLVGLQEIFDTDSFKQSESPLTVALGLSIEGQPKITNISKMPHGLIAGATGSGKSVCINTILISLLYKANYQDVKFLLIDPKMVELAPYNGIPHLVSPVVTDVKAATAALKWAVSEMEERYEKFVHEGVRDITRFNQTMEQQKRSSEKMPFIVIVIDELADLMMVSPQDVEDAICRISQKARACGIHLLVATQRPSVDVITGLIKANIPTRIAFSVSSQVDSRTIIDNAGAEKLLGKGDMLFIENGAGKSIRLQGAFVSDEEIERVTNHARSIAEPNYLFEQDQLLEKMTIDEEEDELLQDVIEFVLDQGSASTSMLQRRFKIGYNRAARLIDTLENRGIISQQNGSKPRDILVSRAQLDQQHQ